MIVHVLHTIALGIGWERSQGQGQKVNDGKVQVGEEVLQFSDPLNTNETSTNHKELGFFFFECFDCLILGPNVPAASFNVTLIELLPLTDLASNFVNSGEPQGFALWFERAKIATAANDAVVKIDGFVLVCEHWLDCGCFVISVQAEHLSPNEFATHLGFNDRVQIKTESVVVLWFHVGTQDTWGVLEKFFGIYNCDQEMRAHVTGNA